MDATGQLAFAGGLEGLDQRISFWMNSHYCPFGDSFWLTMSAVRIWIPLYVLIAALLVWRLGWKRGLVAIAAVALAFFFDERVCNLVKDLVQRVRPCNNEALRAIGYHILEEGGGWSFPSGHACNTFGFAVCVGLCLKHDKNYNWNWLNILLVTWAVLVAISRVMVGRHFLGDVLAGAVIGILMAVLWAYIAGKTFRYLPEN